MSNTSIPPPLNVPIEHRQHQRISSDSAPSPAPVLTVPPPPPPPVLTVPVTPMTPSSPMFFQESPLLVPLTEQTPRSAHSPEPEDSPELIGVSDIRDVVNDIYEDPRMPFEIKRDKNETRPTIDTLISKISSSLNGLQDLSDVCMRKLNEIVHPVPPDERGRIEEGRNEENGIESSIVSAINVIIIVLTYLPILICQAYHIMNYTLGTVLNIASFTAFNDLPYPPGVTLSMAVFSVVFVKITDILNRLITNIFTGRFAWIYIYRFLTSFGITSFLFYCIGLFHDSTLADSIVSKFLTMFFNVIVGVSSLLPEPFRTLWATPIDCGVNGLYCVIPYFFRRKVNNFIQVITDYIIDTRGKVKAIGEEVRNTTNEIWNATTNGAAGVLYIVPDAVESVVEHIAANSDVFNRVSKDVENDMRSLVEDAATSGAEAAVIATADILEGVIDWLSYIRYRALQSAILAQYPFLKDDIEDYSLDELQRLLTLLHTPSDVTGMGQQLKFNVTNLFSGDLNRFMITGTTTYPDMGYVPLPRNPNIFQDRIDVPADEVVIHSKSRKGFNPRQVIPVDEDDTIVDMDVLIDNIKKINQRIKNRPISNIFKMKKSGNTAEVRKSVPNARESTEVEMIDENENMPLAILDIKQESSGERPYGFYFNMQVKNNINFSEKLQEINRNTQALISKMKTEALGRFTLTLDDVAGSSTQEALKILEWLRSPDQQAFSKYMVDNSAEVLSQTGGFMFEVLLHSTAEVAKDTAIDYVFKPGVESIMYFSVSFLTLILGRGTRSVVARRGGRHKKSMKRRSRNKKSTKKHRKHKKSSKKHRKHKRSTKKHRKHKKSSKK